MKEIKTTVDDWNKESGGKYKNFTGKVIITDYDSIHYLENGQLHRIDGHAEIYPNYKQFWLKGFPFKKEEWFNLLSEDEKIQALFNTDEWK